MNKLTNKKHKGYVDIIVVYGVLMIIGATFFITLKCKTTKYLEKLNSIRYDIVVTDSNNNTLKDIKGASYATMNEQVVEYKINGTYYYFNVPEKANVEITPEG